MRRNKRTQPEPAQTGWDVIVVPAMKQSYDNYYYDRAYHRGNDPIPETIAVRLTLNGKPQMTFGTLKITDNEFDDKVTTMKAEAQERAAALNAVGCVA
jgi:hypothetical protein